MPDQFTPPRYTPPPGPSSPGPGAGGAGGHGTIFVINPNSTQAVTDGISRAVQPLRATDGPVVECLTLAEGPPGIETQAHVDGVVAPMVALMRRHEADAAAFVIACYSDPGLFVAREAVMPPVYGIAECGMLSALTRGERFGVIAIKDASIPRHLRYIRQMGLQDRFAGDRAIGLGVVELTDEERVRARMIEVGRTLRDRDGADVLVMGCAGMARYRQAVSDGTGLPVIEPTQAAVGMAITAARLARAEAAA